MADGDPEKRPAGQDDWVSDLARSFQRQLTGGLLEGVYALPEEPLRRVLDSQARACVAAFSALVDLPPDLDLPSFLARMRTDGPGQLTITPTGPDEMLWTEARHNGCVCPHVRLGIARLDRALCGCGEIWVRLLLERHARRPAEVSLVESVATGAENCVYRVRLR